MLPEPTSEEIMEQVKQQIETTEKFKMNRRKEHLMSLRIGHVCKYCGTEVIEVIWHTYCPDAWDLGNLGLNVGCL